MNIDKHGRAAGDKARRVPSLLRTRGSLRPIPSHPKAFSLLEVLLALAILAGAIAALGEVMRLGDENAALARDESQAEMLANSLISEMLSGARQVQAVSSATFDMTADPAWNYSI